MAKKSTIKTNWPKWTLQWTALAAIIFFVSGLAEKLFPKIDPVDPEAYCPLGGLEAFTTYLSRGSLPCSMDSAQILMGLAMAACVILFSKLFCSYVCPVGTLEDLISMLRNAAGFQGVKVRNFSVLDKVFRIFKYGILFWIFYMTATASELFCKNMDPYYAVATGFKGEITLWMSIVSLVLVVVGGLVIDRFWCRYICPLGAASNSLKFWLPLAGLSLVYWVLSKIGVSMQWWWLLAAFCLCGYLLEIFHSRPALQILHVIRDEDTCGGRCMTCQKNCPYNIDVPSFGAVVKSVDCTLCGECVTSCPTKSLKIGVCKTPPKSESGKFIPAILTVLFFAAGIIVGGKFELPTIDFTWGVEEGMKLETMRIDNIKSIHCYGSSMAFKGKMEKIAGVHGVKTFVGSHSAVVKYDPAVISAEQISEKMFVPSHFRVATPERAEHPVLRVQTIRTEHMPNKTDLNMLGLQMRLTGKQIYGLESEYDCPLIIRVYSDISEELSEEWYREIVNKKVLEMPVHGGGVKETPLDFDFVRLEKEESTIDVETFLTKMFDTFSAEYNGKYPSGDTTVVKKRNIVYEDAPQFIYEVENPGFEKPIYMRYFPYLSNHLSKEEGVIAMYVQLNSNYIPALQVRFAAPMTADRIWELMTMEKWTITYKDGEVKEQDAMISFKEPGICYPYKKAE